MQSPCIPIIAVSELWTCEDNESLYNIPGYNFVVRSRQGKLGGGVGLYISDKLRYTLRDELEAANTECVESVFIELEPNNFIIGCIYRPPNSDVAFFY